MKRWVIIAMLTGVALGAAWAEVLLVVFALGALSTACTQYR